MKHVKTYEALVDDFSQYEEYQEMVNLIYDATNSVFIVKKDGTINMKYWFNNLDKKRIEFIYKKLQNFDYEIYGCSAIEIFNIKPEFITNIEKEYNFLKSTKQYNL